MISIDVLLLLSGPVAVGKTSLRQELISNYKFDYLRTGAYLLDIANQRGLGVDRTALQELGDALDQTTDYRWLLTDIALPAFSANLGKTCWLVDAVRKERQIERFRGQFEKSVLHVHLTAPEEILRTRYENRAATNGATCNTVPYDIVTAHQNEISARSLGAIADLVIDTSLVNSKEAAKSVIDAIGRRRV